MKRPGKQKDEKFLMESRLEGLKKRLRKFDRFYQAGSFVHCWAVCGRKEAVRRYREHYEELAIRAELNRRNELTAEDREKQEKTRFPKEILFSILVPLYNTPLPFLEAMIASVQVQTYGNWELCLADGSDDAHADVGRVCREKAAQDKRILYRKLERNEGISGNTNHCIGMAGGDYLALFDHDDILHPSALFEVMNVLCRQDADLVYTDENTFHKTPADAYLPHFKPDFAPDTLRGNNYICHFTVFRKGLLEKAGGGFRSAFDGSQDYDLVLRLTEQAETIVHIPKILYYWRAHRDSVAESVGAKPYVVDAAKRAIGEHLERIGLRGEVLETEIPSIYRIRYEIQGEPLVSILIPNKDHREDLKRCIDSIREKSTWQHWETVIIENNSTEAETFRYYEELEKDERIRVVRYEGSFNYSAVNNLGARESRGAYLLLLNNDTEVISPDWIQEMLMFAQREDVGAVGAKLYYPDGTIQHAGIGLGLLHLAGHYFRGFPAGRPGYMARLCYAQDLTAVTAACMMVPRKVYGAVGGLDESFSVVFNDVDLCLKIRESGKLVVWTPFAELTHYESKSRGSDEDTPEKLAFFKTETRRFQTKWNAALAKGDPYYNPNLTREKENMSPRAEIRTDEREKDA